MSFSPTIAPFLSFRNSSNAPGSISIAQNLLRSSFVTPSILNDFCTLALHSVSASVTAMARTTCGAFAAISSA